MQFFKIFRFGHKLEDYLNKNESLKANQLHKIPDIFNQLIKIIDLQRTF